MGRKRTGLLSLVVTTRPGHVCLTPCTPLTRRPNSQACYYSPQSNSVYFVFSVSTGCQRRIQARFVYRSDFTEQMFVLRFGEVISSHKERLYESDILEKRSIRPS